MVHLWWNLHNLKMMKPFYFMMLKLKKSIYVYLSLKLWNHRTHNRLFKILCKNNIPAKQILQITGQNNIQSIKSCSSSNESLHINISQSFRIQQNLERSSESATLKKNSPKTDSQNTLNNSVATCTTLNATGGGGGGGGSKTMLTEIFKVKKKSLLISKTNQILHPIKGTFHFD